MQASSNSAPRDAAAVILLRHNTDRNNPEVFWVKRSPKLAFLGGFYAFPGGQAESSDREAPIENCEDHERAAMISCAARETFEEIGILLARGADTLTAGQRRSLLDDLESARMSWPELLRHFGLHLDASDFTFVGRWVTPPFAPSSANELANASASIARIARKYPRTAREILSGEICSVILLRMSPPSRSGYCPIVPANKSQESGARMSPPSRSGYCPIVPANKSRESERRLSPAIP